MAGNAAAYHYYYRYTAPNGERVRMPVGTAIDLRTAQQLATDLSRRYQSGDRDLRTVLEAEQRERQCQQEVAARAREAEASMKRATLGALLDGYIGAGVTVEVCTRQGRAREIPCVHAQLARDLDYTECCAIMNG